MNAMERKNAKVHIDEGDQAENEKLAVLCKRIVADGRFRHEFQDDPIGQFGLAGIAVPSRFEEKAAGASMHEFLRSGGDRLSRCEPGELRGARLVDTDIPQEGLWVTATAVVAVAIASTPAVAVAEERPSQENQRRN